MEAPTELIILTTFRGLERLAIVFGAVYVVLLGYRLYELGITKGKSVAEFKSSFAQFAVSGTGPGLSFMTGGVVILVVALFMPVATSNVVRFPQNSDQGDLPVESNGAVSRADEQSLTDEKEDHVAPEPGFKGKL